MCLAELLKCLGEACENAGCASGSLGVAVLSDCDGEIVAFTVGFDRDADTAVPKSGTGSSLPFPSLFGQKGA